MYNLLFVDDEPLVLESVKMIVNQHRADRFTVATVTSGQEAIDYVEANPVDLIFIDILIPGISGIETISRIRKRFPKIRFMIISAYDDFDYAKRAVELDVIEYILKPINKKILLNCLDKCEAILDEDRQKEQLLRDYEQERRHTTPLIEAQLLQQLLYRPEETEKIRTFSNLLHMDYNNGAAISILCRAEGGECCLSDQMENVEQQLRSKNRCILQKAAGGQISILMPFDSELSAPETEKRAMATMQRIISVSEKQGIRIAAGIGTAYHSEREIHGSFTQAMLALGHADFGSCVIYSEALGGTMLREEFPQEKEDRLIELTRQGNSAALSLLVELMQWYCGNPNISLREINFSLLPLLNTILSIRDRSGTMLYSRKEQIEQNETFLSLPSRELMEEFLLNVIRTVCKLQNEDSRRDNTDRIARIAKYVEEHYQENITLETLANQVNYSSAYLSHMFHKYMHMRLTDYITEIRMEKANELLLSGGYSVKEAADLVGYPNANYFCRLYKKTFGVTVTEYIRQKKNHPEFLDEIENEKG